jgi:hypothetical protein
MTLDWPNLLVGAILGAIPGYFVHWAFVKRKEYSGRRKLERAYSSLAGDYVNFRAKDDVREEPTGGTIRLTWRPDGSVQAQGLHANGVAEWESTIRMSLEFNGTGTGHYRYIGKEDSGNQQVTYSRESRTFIVMSTNTSSTGREFFHRWRRIETA